MKLLIKKSNTKPIKYLEKIKNRRRLTTFLRVRIAPHGYARVVLNRPLSMRFAAKRDPTPQAARGSPAAFSRYADLLHVAISAGTRAQATDQAAIE